MFSLFFAVTFASIVLVVGVSLIILMFRRNHNSDFQQLQNNLVALANQNKNTDIQLRETLLLNFNRLEQNILQKLSDARLEQSKQTMEALTLLQDSLTKGSLDNRQQIKESLSDHALSLGTKVEQLTQLTGTKLQEINLQVEKRLTEGFEKTNATFGDVIKRLAFIDAAQQKITELSSNVVSLKDILNDKRSRGAFGEVQLSSLVHNMIPESHFSFQHLLSNHRRPDCMLFLPEPTGNIAIDAKFPLENFRLLTDPEISNHDKTSAEKQFKIDIKKHIQDIADKYIITGETADGAVMFIPAEAIFAEIHAKHPDLVVYAQRRNVWLVSPTTLMAVLTTARAVLKDAATRKQVHEIQKHLRLLSNDFDRFQNRMEQLSKHISQAHLDVEQVHISSKKISQRFIQIDKAELEEISLEPLNETIN